MTLMSAEADAPPRRSFQEVWVVSIGHALTHWYPATFYLLLPLIGAELGLSYGQIGSILTCQYAAGAISNIPGGIFVDTVGRKGLLMAVALFWIGFPYLMMGLSHAYWMMLCWATPLGIGNNLWHPTAIPWLADRFPERKGLVMSFHSMGGNVGDAFAPLVVGALLAVFCWRSVVVMNVIPGVAMSALIMFYIGRIHRTETAAGAGAKPSRGAGDRAAARLPAARQPRGGDVVGVSTFRTMTQSALLTFLPVYLARDMGYSPFWIGACMFALQAAGFIAAPIAGHLSDTVGRRQIIVVQMSMTAVVLARHDLRRQHAVVRAADRGARLLPVRGARRAAGLAARRDAAGASPAARSASCSAPRRRRGDRADLRRNAGRPLRHHGGVLFPGRHHHRRQSDDFLHAVGDGQEHLAAKVCFCDVRGLSPH